MFFATAVFAVSLLSAIVATQHVDKRIVGGVPAKPGQIPYQAEIIQNRFIHVCGGSIIHNKWIVTAAHCFYKDKSNTGDPIDLNIFHAQVGSVLTQQGDLHHFDKRLIHDNPIFNDIALVRTATEMNLKNPNIKPIKMSSIPLTMQKPVSFSGWGKTSVNN